MSHTATLASAGFREAAPVTLLNAPVMTTDGLYRLITIRPDAARALVHSRGFRSAIGHAESAQLLSLLLGVECPVNRIDYCQKAGELALVLRLARRLPEGLVLRSIKEIEAVGYTLALLERVPDAADFPRGSEFR